MIYLDQETCGLAGIPVLLQYAIDDGPIILWNYWKEPVRETLSMIEWIVQQDVCGFNLAFDWFHICKVYTTFQLLAMRESDDAYPDEHIDLLGVLEMEARDGPCLKPKGSLDLMLHARKGPFQSLMNRDDIRIKRVPTPLAWELSRELQRRIPMPDIYFARSGDGRGVDRFKVYDIHDEDGNMITDFKDIVCKFSPSTALKALAVHALGVQEEDVLKFKDIECNMYPNELGYAPFAMSIGKPGAWNGAWPEVIHHHITHWGYNELARRYASNDIVYTRGLHKYFTNVADPKFGVCVVNDHDSILATLVAAVRWRGLKVDIEGIKELREEAEVLSKSCVKDGAKVKDYLREVCNDTEFLAFRESTKKQILEDVVKDKEELWCNEDGSQSEIQQRCANVLAARRAKKEVELYDKLILAGRFHCSFVVIGTKSSRMSGTDGLNPQGINHSTKVRSKFPFAWDGLVLCGGDFSSFEVSLAAAVYRDPLLDADLKLGKKMAGLFGQVFFPDMSYEDILDSEGEEEDFYDKSKRTMYAIFYGGNEATLEDRIGINKEFAKEKIDELMQRYKGIGQEAERIRKQFGCMSQPGGIGTKVVWKDPDDYVEAPIGGFKRFFTLENRICKALFDLGNKPPEHWKEFKIKVVRRDRQQTVGGATQSALYAAAFNIQSSMMRQAGNHKIQCSGSKITKHVQVVVWEFQPVGIHEWYVMPFNCHDEVDAPCKPEIKHDIEKRVMEIIETYRPQVPMIKMKWKLDLVSWKGQ